MADLADGPIVFYRRSLAAPVKACHLPQGFRIEWQSLGWGGRTGVRGSRWRLLAWCLLFKRKRAPERYGSIVVRTDEGVVAHSAMVLPRYFRSPFMAEPDLQIGSLYTDPKYRGQGLATAAVAATLDRLQRLGFRAATWYVVDRTNTPSKFVAERNDFSVVGRGQRAKRLHTLLFGSYVTDHSLGLGHPRFDYAMVTERRDMRAPPEQRAMAAVRHAFVGRVAAGRCLLDVACGTGLGMQALGDRACLSVGLDISLPNLLDAQSHLPASTLVAGSGTELPFRAHSIEVMSCLEALYYFPDPPAFILEARRVLQTDGSLIVVVTNPARPGFLQSPGSTYYPTLEELRSWLAQAGFRTVAYGAFPWVTGGAGGRVKDVGRRAVGRVGIMPTSLKMRSWFKRLVYRDMRRLDTIGPLGRLGALNSQLHELSENATSATTHYKTLLLHCCSN